MIYVHVLTSFTLQEPLFVLDAARDYSHQTRSTILAQGGPHFMNHYRTLSQKCRTSPSSSCLALKCGASVARVTLGMFSMTGQSPRDSDIA